MRHLEIYRPYSQQVDVQLKMVQFCCLQRRILPENLMCIAGTGEGLQAAQKFRHVFLGKNM